MRVGNKIKSISQPEWDRYYAQIISALIHAKPETFKFLQGYEIALISRFHTSSLSKDHKEGSAVTVHDLFVEQPYKIKHKTKHHPAELANARYKPPKHNR